MSKDWREPPETYIHALGCLRTGSELLADLEYLEDAERERVEGHWPADTWTWVTPYPCNSCGVYVKVPFDICPWCSHDKREAA